MRISDWSSDVRSSDLGKGGASFPFHEIEHLEGDARAHKLIPFFDRRYDSAWAMAHRDQYGQLVAMFSADPYGVEPGIARSEWRRVGKARASTCHSLRPPPHYKTQPTPPPPPPT